MAYPNRDEAIKRIRAGLLKRTGKAWSVTTPSKGTSWGWITIAAPPRRQVDDYDQPKASGGHTSKADREELKRVLGLDSVHHQGISIPAGSDYYQEYVDRAEGRKPSVLGKHSW